MPSECQRQLATRSTLPLTWFTSAMYSAYHSAYLVGRALDVLVGLRCFVFGVAPVRAVKRVLQRPLNSLLLLLLACQGRQLASDQEAAGIPSRVVESRPRVEPTVSWPRCKRTIHTSDWAHLDGSDRAVPVGVGFGGLVGRRHVVDCSAGVVSGDASAETRHTATDIRLLRSRWDKTKSWMARTAWPPPTSSMFPTSFHGPQRSLKVMILPGMVPGWSPPVAFARYANNLPGVPTCSSPLYWLSSVTPLPSIRAA
jgi:hypothetical protein